MRTVIQSIAVSLLARKNCDDRGNTEWFNKHSETIRAFADILPSGAGIDSGSSVDLLRSDPERIVIYTAYHHMNEDGCYDGWTEHDIIVTPSLSFGFEIEITGKDRNDIKDYLGETFQYCLSQHDPTGPPSPILTALKRLESELIDVDMEVPDYITSIMRELA